MKVKMYTTPSCPWCMREKEFLKKNKIPFQEVDVSANEQEAAQMVEKSGQMGVPVTEVDGQIVVGFDEPRLKALLNVK
ncbi:MAG: glutathione S-transferase N-terminal domain-containing protein [Candidatus Aenigmarchaeota archaeon]|nr:glutathione S-transferase N-terminal domain-containing protein [Candidatus Aenigmarchaeota archaeon]